ncbi:hypothetical protein K493DRAFT_302727 [Basidiobolus meristosporus CBS 931.73]|uniref:Uncharacterized protein n=1 Tax=Basidiobolus meristosporus CBS 931.73 TaxID=1314790 RepID=A0A1Y1Y5Q9_9FUNG|nr:hypothetical protein K493DRAFT_302727 [Basidiobolus meristosporus CBS 931.73]|eukprot:ORX93361.1 hypothetical protein K493DRAFT_302727 [Basidiobolus meristosporus CBS 931.73]
MSHISQTKALLSRLCYGILILWVCVEANTGDLRRRATDLTPSSPLGLKVNYRVAWLNTSTGQFGGNLTIFAPTTASSTPYWKMKFLFTDQYTKINEYWGEWTMERYKSGSYIILPVAGKEHLVESYCFNGQFTAHNELDQVALLGLISPTSYTLILNSTTSADEQEISLPPNDYVNTPLDLNTPSNPFGPYFRASRPLAKPNPGALDASEFGDGTTIQTPPVGLYIYSVVFLVGAGVVGAGTYRRLQYRIEFRRLIETQKLKPTPFHQPHFKS